MGKNNDEFTNEEFATLPAKGTVANAPIVKLRKEPNPKSSTIRVLREGTVCDVLGKEGEYWKVTWRHNTGYILDKYFREG